jgi:hypothetical protein
MLEHKNMKKFDAYFPKKKKKKKAEELSNFVFVMLHTKTKLLQLAYVLGDGFEVTLTLKMCMDHQNYFRGPLMIRGPRVGETLVQMNTSVQSSPPR